MKKVLSILLSFVLLSSHVYLTIGTHFCGGEAIESKIIVGEAHLGCGMMDMGEACGYSYNNEGSIDEASCCKNEYQTVQASVEFVKDAAFNALSNDIAVTITYSTLNFDLFPKVTNQFYTEYNPPPLEKDIQLLFQTFLI